MTAFTTKAAGSVMDMVLTKTQPAASVTVIVYAPALRLESEGKVSVKPVHAYDKGCETLDAVMLILPSDPPLQLTLLLSTSVSEGPDKLLILAMVLAVHPLKSVTVKV